MLRIKTLTFIIGICALTSGAQTLTATYVELADSADRYIGQHRWADAERVIVRALQHEPANKSNYLMWSNLGMVRTNQMKYEEALEAFDIGLASAPHSTVLLTNRAQTNLALDRKEDAMSDLNRALEIDGTLQWPLKMRGLLKVVAGDMEGATADFNTYKQIYGSDAAVAEAEGDMANALGQGDVAIERYEEALRLAPEQYLMTKLLVTAHFYGRLEEQESTIAEEIRKHPGDGSLYLMRAMLNKQRFQTEAAERDLKTARELGVDEILYRQMTEQPTKQNKQKNNRQ